MIKKYKLLLLITISAAVIAGCGDQKVESVNEEKNQKEQEKTEDNTQISVEEFCKTYGITMKKDGYSYLYENEDRDIVIKNDSSKEVEINTENEDESTLEGETKESNSEVVFQEAKDDLSDEDKVIISQFISDEDKTMIQQTEDSKSYEEFDLYEITDEKRVAINKKTLFTEETNYCSGERTLGYNIAETHIEELEGNICCLTMQAANGSLCRIFFTDDGKTMWEVEQTSGLK